MGNRLISLIIPVQNDQELLPDLLNKVLAQTLKPFDVVIVDSSDAPLQPDKLMRESFARENIGLQYLHSQPLAPGAARNLGVQQSTGGLIAFLDVRTLPPGNWLEDMRSSIEAPEAMGALGKTVYLASTQSEKWIRAATYGVNPVTTIPGSLLKREVFSVVGSFLPSVIAGEDTDWMLRARLHGLALPTINSASISYHGLVGMRFSDLMRKWLRNYRACRNIPYLTDHKAIYLFIFNLFVILVAMNWNEVFAHWDESSSIYVRHITKITVALVCLLYLGYRGFYLPMRRGVPLRFLIPWNWLFVFCIGLVIDIVKMIAFVPSRQVMMRRTRFAFLRE